MWLFEGLAATALFCAIMILVLSRALLLLVPAERMALLGGLIELRLAERLLNLVRGALLGLVVEYEITLLMVFRIFLVRTPQRLLYLEAIQWVLSEYLDVHPLLLLLYDQVQLSQYGLDCFVFALIILQELLHVSQSVPKFGLVY